MKKKWMLGAVVWLLGGMVLFGTGRVSEWKNAHSMPEMVKAANDQQEIGEKTDATNSDQVMQLAEVNSYDMNSAQQRKEALEKEKEELENGLSQVNKYTDDVQKYVTKLDAQLIRLVNREAENRKEIKKIKNEVDAVNLEYSRAEERQQTQFAQMKAQIQYMYENSNESFLEFFIGARDLAEMYSRQEYVSKIMAYDNNIFSQYSAVLQEVTLAKRDAEAKYDELTELKNTIAYEKKAVQRLSSEKGRQIEMFQTVQQQNQTSIKSYSQQIADAENQIEALMQNQRTQIASQESGADGKPIVVPTVGEYAWPLTAAGRISSTFGYRSAPTAGASTYHRGVDIAVNTGTNVLATKNGKVVTATYSASAGNYICIYHGGGVYSYYMHCTSLNVKVGTNVKKGQVIAKSGSTGISTGPHLHFAIFSGGKYVNPMYYVNQP